MKLSYAKKLMIHAVLFHHLHACFPHYSEAHINKTLDDIHKLLIRNLAMTDKQLWPGKPRKTSDVFAASLTTSPADREE